MDKYLLKDIFAIAGSVIAGFIVGLIFHGINPYFDLYLYLVIGGGAAVVAFVLYLILRKPDKLIELEKSLLRTAHLANSISKFASRLQGFPEARTEIGKIATAFAKLGDKCLRRELIPLEVEILRIETSARSFLGILSIMSGDVALPRARMQEELEQVLTEHIPETENTVQQLEVAIDASIAKRRAREEEDLKIINKLYENHKNAQEAAAMLRGLMKKTY